MALGGVPSIRAGARTDNGNSIIDVTGLSFVNPVALEIALNQLPGAVCNGVFALPRADIYITAGAAGVSVQSPYRQGAVATKREIGRTAR